MNTNLKTLPKALAKPCFGNSGLLSCAINVKPASQEEELAGYATIDGNVVTHHVGSDAVSSGSGIFIGDYFVGIADSYELISITPFVRY